MLININNLVNIVNKYEYNDKNIKKLVYNLLERKSYMNKIVYIDELDIALVFSYV